MKLLTVFTGLLLATLSVATPTDPAEDFALAARCKVKCGTGSEEYQNPATGQCSCVKIRGCTELCTANLTYYTNPATGVCSCVPKCSSTVTCPSGYNCVTTNTTSGAGACVEAQPCTMDCISGDTTWVNPATGVCSCVETCPALATGNNDGCPTGFECLPAQPSVICDIAGACARVCLAEDGCLSC